MIMLRFVNPTWSSTFGVRMRFCLRNTKVECHTVELAVVFLGDFFP